MKPPLALHIYLYICHSLPSFKHSVFYTAIHQPYHQLTITSHKNKMKPFLIFIVSILLLQASVGYSFLSNAPNSPANIGEESEVVAIDKKHYPKKINCGYLCSRRCRASSRKNVCHRACKTCCYRCHCVPPGTYGNKNACPCYANLRTHGNKPKCP